MKQHTTFGMPRVTNINQRLQERSPKAKTCKNNKMSANKIINALVAIVFALLCLLGYGVYKEQIRRKLAVTTQLHFKGDLAGRISSAETREFNLFIRGNGDAYSYFEKESRNLFYVGYDPKEAGVEYILLCSQFPRERQNYRKGPNGSLVTKAKHLPGSNLWLIVQN